MWRVRIIVAFLAAFLTVTFFSHSFLPASITTTTSPNLGGGFRSTTSAVHEGSRQVDHSSKSHQFNLSSLSKSTACPQTWPWLHELEGTPDVSFPLRFSRREIVVRRQAESEHSSLTEVNETLLPEFSTIASLAEIDTVPAAPCLLPLVLDVPYSARPDASHILLGMASTVERLESSFTYLERWLAHTRARLFVMVKGPDETQPVPGEMKSMEAKMRGSGINVTLIKPLKRRDNFVQRYFSLVKVLYENSDAATQWLGLIDDDTFFVSMTALIDRLQSFDHRKPYYIGALSEEWHTVVMYGLIGMGGAGIFLSLPAAHVIYDHHDECKRSTTKSFGDHMVFECLEQHSDIRLTHMNGLYQLDIHGDRSGILESGRQVLTLHHWKEGYWSEDGSGLDGIRHPRWFPLDQMSLVQEVCGDSCFLQRFRFENDTILTNGYSIAQYPTQALQKAKDGTATDLDRMEYTWVKPAGTDVKGSVNDGYDHYLGPTRPALELEVEKIHWRFMKAQMADGGVRQYFRRLGKDGRLDELVELFWRTEESEPTA